MDGFTLDHTCRKHQVHDESCKACRWWKRHGRCHPKKFNTFDPNRMYAYLLKYYIEQRNYTVEQANDMACHIVSEQMERHNAQQAQQKLL